ncbi:MAG: holo-ACP synthase [Aestuariivita sp.]|nr:holo-ACP synthase [Aestuariivita sp.]MCY4201205.1 holo-ACP synthase [Aestuariivita sp.]MCY4288983.1 holo-ACP synthase [Aestuariivita sp.]MCY4346572.1 holo-ACP synthase [Aestuariivita sp.]
MILGIGTDITNIDRIRRTLERFGDRFKYRVFSSEERNKAARRLDDVGTYAKRWAAKEACCKALGTGLRMGISWQDMIVNNAVSGQPTLQLTGWAAGRLNDITPLGHIASIHLSLTDDYPWAQAFVVIEATPTNEQDHLDRLRPVLRDRS